jgi:TolA-binding protein
MRLLPIWTLALAGLLLTAAWPAAAQPLTREEIELHDQVYQLQQEVQALQAQVAQQRNGGSYLGQQQGYPPPRSGAGAGGDLVAQLLTQVQSLEAEVRDLRGRIDETQNELKQSVADLGKRIDDLAFQVNQGAGNPGAGTAGAPAAGAPAAPGEEAPPAGPSPQESQGAMQGGAPQMLSPPPAPLGATRAAPPPAPVAAPPVRLTPEQAIARGNAALARHDYAAAEAAARDVLNNYRTSPRAYEAQYMLAQSLAGQRRFAQAAIAFDDTYNRNRKGSRAQEALVGLAGSLTDINEKRAACDTLTKLHTEFPQEHPGVRDAAASIRQRAGCR